MKQVKRILVAVAGATVLAVVIGLVVLPGPAFLVIPAGLAILAIEFGWARRWLHSSRNLFRQKKSVPKEGYRMSLCFHLTLHSFPWSVTPFPHQMETTNG